MIRSAHPPISVPDPKRPPTAADGFRQVLPVWLQIAASPLALVPAAVAWLGLRVAWRPSADWYCVHPRVAWALCGVVTVALVAGLVAWARSRRMFRPYGVAAAVGVLLAAFAVPVSGFAMDPRARTSSLVMPSGVTLGVVRRGTDEFVVQETWRFLLLWARCHEIARHDAWYQLDGTCVVRPDGPGTSGLFPAADGTVLLVNSSGRAVAAMQPPLERGTWRSADVTELSPFALLGPLDTGLEEDVARLVGRIHAAVPPHPWRSLEAVPGEAALVAGLDSPNPWVHAAARRLIEAGGERLYPAAMRRLGATR